jgi:hypothetical protein
MTEFWSRIGPSELIPLVAIIGGLVCGSITIIGLYWHKICQTELKQDMLNRGMSAEEIKTVLDAGHKS